MRVASASSAFSTSSLTTLAGRSMTSPAAIWFATCSGSRRTRFIGASGGLWGGLRRPRQAELENRSTPGFMLRLNPPAVVFHDALADGEAQACAMDFAVGGERLEQLPEHLDRNAGSGVLDFRDDFPFVHAKPQRHFATGRHRFAGILDEIMKNALESFWVH